MVAFKNDCFDLFPIKNKSIYYTNLYGRFLYIGGGHFDNGDHFEFKTFKYELHDQKTQNLIYC